MYATEVRVVRAVREHYIRLYNRQRTSPLRRDGANFQIRLCTGLAIPLTYDLLPNIKLRDACANSGIIYPSSPPSLMVLLV